MFGSHLDALCFYSLEEKKMVNSTKGKNEVRTLLLRFVDQSKRFDSTREAKFSLSASWTNQKLLDSVLREYLSQFCQHSYLDIGDRTEMQ